MNFDPFGLAGRYLPESTLHTLVRGFMVLLLTGFLLHRLSQYALFSVKLLWVAETALFSVLIVAYLFRSAPVDRSRGFAEIVIPLTGSALPFALLLSPPAQLVIRNSALFHGLLWVMAAATLLTVWSMWTLRRSFSITVETRNLVTSGPYRFLRHPVYCGEILAAAAVAAIRLSIVNAVLILLFIALQLYRCRLEERKLMQTFPEYRQHLAGSLWFWRV
jgi:protein-S-isoprenylcysteine O-methyltransferase Ste14